MQMRYLGHSGLQVSALGFGTMTFGGAGDYFADFSTSASTQASISSTRRTSTPAASRRRSSAKPSVHAAAA